MAQRYMFINASSAAVQVHVITQDPIDVCELVDSTPVEKPEQVIETRPAGEFDLLIPAGAIYGFVTQHTASVKVPNPLGFVMRNDVPWPEPPPSRSGLKPHKSDFAARYRCFLDLQPGVPYGFSAASAPVAATSSSGETSAKLDEIIALLRGCLAARGQYALNGSQPTPSSMRDPIEPR